MSVSLTEEKETKILKLIQSFLTMEVCTIRHFARLIGLLLSACPATKYGWLYTKNLEREKVAALLRNHQNFNAKMVISKLVKQELVWWENTIPQARNNIRRDTFHLEIFTDASRIGWGAIYKNQKANGWWTPEEQKHHINYLEMLSVLYALNKKVSFGTFNTYRSALALITGCEIERSPNIRRYLKDIFRLRPPTRKYQSTWDPQVVLTYLEPKYPNENLSLLELSKKTITLLALASGQRLQTLAR
ncbi:hypothetical protein NQ314_003558 [Rhamnusium bicolor]|uniref:Uncharacterized protein n=1 Tax=Rhamnusium bicolor TaxID=1586634 RepID=A0AAV8ZPJ0_9CUCU|nr:hypothetical protein NQ314_003558 [Rhamnusium bicolor]